MSTLHPDTIGTIEHGGVTYEIDWPADPEHASIRNQCFAFIYVDGEMAGEFDPWEFPQGIDRFSTEEEVMRAAHHVVPERFPLGGEGQ